MAKYLPHTPKETKFKTLFRYFVQGVVILAPVAITAYILYTIFNWIDGFLRPIFITPGIGFVLIIAFIIFIGWLSSYFIMESMINFFDHWLERTPGIKLIYKSIKDFFQAFGGDKKKFTKAVLANVFNNDVWMVGFLTDDEMEKFNLGNDMVGVYVPQAYNFAGQLYILPKERVRPIENISPGDAMKYTVTGGVVES
ncbi:DUF502 domain-containing protein [Niabella insulamsoli]|uniref:DUF502 domain-containing protein n=1 Tax=Niabella insulamsoli TaxID=3144874 RepID=UPI0031FCA631